MFVEALLRLASHRSGVRVVYHHALLTASRSSIQGALALTCAARQDALEAALRSAFETGYPWTRPEGLGAFAERLRISVVPFLECVDDPATLEQVVSSFGHSRTIGVVATPTYVVNGLVGVGAPAELALREAIEYAKDPSRD
jgi:protein-disulfide isomerase